MRDQQTDIQLLRSYLEKTLSFNDVALLEKRICTEDELAELLLELSCDEAIIREWHCSKQSGGNSIFNASNRKHDWFPFFRSKQNAIRTAITLSLLMFWGGVTFLGYHFYTSFSKPAKAIAVVNKSVTDQPATNKIKNQQKTITEGTVELLLPTGVKVIIAAPATFQITGKNEISLSHGMLLAEVTTEAGKGFTVKTPSSINVDLGTVFGIAVDQKGTSVTQVFRGIVNSTNNLSMKNSSPSQTVQLTTNERILHRTDGTSTQEIKNLAGFFFVNFDHSNSSNKTRVAKLIGINKITAKNLREQQEKNHASMTDIASLEEEVSLSNKSPSNTNATAGFYNSFDNELAIEMGGAIKNAKQGPQHANLTYEDGGVLIKEGSRLSFETKGRLNNKKGRIFFRIKPNWDGATDKQRRTFFSSGPFHIGKWYGGSGKQARPYVFFRFDSTTEIQNSTSTDNLMTGVLESWKKGTKHTIEVEWDLTLPLGQQYLMLTVDGLSSKTMTGTWDSVQALSPTFVIGANKDFQRSADALFDEIHIDNKLKGNKE